MHECSSLCYLGCPTSCSHAGDDSEAAESLVSPFSGSVLQVSEDTVARLASVTLMSDPDAFSTTSNSEDTVSRKGADSSALDDSPPDLEEAIESDDTEDLEEDLPQPEHLAGFKISPWIEYKGKRIHKATLCRLIITPNHMRLSHERVLRVRGYMSDWKLRNSDNAGSPDITDPNSFFVGDLVAALVRCDDEICLALLKTIAIEQHGRLVEGVPLQHMTASGSGIKLTGQILCMEDTGSAVSAVDSGDKASSGSIADASAWIWTGAFARFAQPPPSGRQPSMPALTAKSARKTVAVKLPSHLCEVINPDIINARIRYPTSSAVARGTLNTSGITWELSQGTMSLLVSQLWANLQKHGVPGAFDLLPTFKTQHCGIPYCTGTGEIYYCHWRP